MTPKDLATLAVRLLALYALIPTVFTVEQIWAEQTSGGSLQLPLAPALVILALGLLLWFLAPALGRAMSWSQEPLQGLGLDLQTTAQVGIAALGLLLVVLSVSGFVQALTYRLSLNPALYSNLLPMYQGELAGTGVQILLGIAIFFGRRGLARAFAAARNY